MIEFEVVTAVNDDAVLRQNLLASPMVVRDGIPVHVERGCCSASIAYNRGLEKTKSDIVVFAHQDVYFPEAWPEQLERTVRELGTRSAPWGILGVWGVNELGRFAGRVWCSGGNREHIGQAGIQDVCSVDEIVIVMNRAADLTFDDGLPGFHLHGTDIILEARSCGYEAFAFTGPVVHNSRFNANVFDRSYFQAYRYLRRKWASQLPIETCCSRITRTGWPLYRLWLQRELRRITGRASGGQRRPCGAELAEILGYDQCSRVEAAS